MAFFQMNFFSKALCSNTDVNVFIPTPDSDEILNNKSSDYFCRGIKFQTLYLLHGAYGDYSDWMRLTSIEKYAQKHKLAVIMPSAANSFYQNMAYGSDYLTYLGEELPEVMEILFPLAVAREDRFVAGLSMGGYGALKLAFEKPDFYSAGISLSGALDIVKVVQKLKEGTMEGPFRMECIFKNPEALKGTDADIFALIQKDKKAGKRLPRVFQSCGTEDFLYEMNKEASRTLEGLAVDITYEEHPGAHDWDYWDVHIQRALDWLSLKNDSIKEKEKGTSFEKGRY